MTALSCRTTRGGYTLLELVVAVGVSGILIAGLSSSMHDLADFPVTFSPVDLARAVGECLAIET